MDRLDRCKAFLETGLSRKPVVIEWHRLYQGMGLSAGDQEATIARYDQLLAEDPDNSALLYLRGRLTPRAKEACAYYDRAIAADASNPYPYFAKSYHLFAKLQFEEAKPLAAKAVELMPDHADMARTLFEIRFALGEYAALEAELKEALLKNPGDLGTQERLLRVLVADGRVEEANKAHQQFAQRAGGGGGPDDADLSLQSEMALCYLTGDLEGWLSRAEKLSSPDSINTVAALAHLELGHLEEAAKELGEDPSEHSGFSALLFSLAWKQKGNRAEADRWRQAAIKLFAAASPDDALVAGLLAQGDQVDVDEVDELSLQRGSKALVLVALADASPTHRQELLDRAETLNTLGAFPYQFLKRTIETMRSEASPAAAAP
jgi:tetratricopeptide (TPR) repeat protein